MTKPRVAAGVALVTGFLQIICIVRFNMFATMSKMRCTDALGSSIRRADNLVAFS